MLQLLAGFEDPIAEDEFLEGQRKCPGECVTEMAQAHIAKLGNVKIANLVPEMLLHIVHGGRQSDVTHSLANRNLRRYFRSKAHDHSLALPLVHVLYGREPLETALYITRRHRLDEIVQYPVAVSPNRELLGMVSG